MANDPERDILPVKQLAPSAGGCVRIDPVLVAKLKRSDLEDKFISYYEENNELKKIKNSQEIKIKKLGTKLLRVINESKSSNGQFAGNSESAENDASVRLAELERENYALKDKNTVLRQQLASHYRQHMAAHRSPVHMSRAQSSSRLSQRQASVPNINEETFAIGNGANSLEMQLRDAENHIASLNSEIKMFQSQQATLQHEIEQYKVLSQKTQVSENIELIKLRRQKKQLESQLKVAEHSQKILQQDVTRLQKENEDALQIIADRQDLIIELQSKVDDSIRVGLECEELKGRVTHLKGERDIFKERCEDLLKAAAASADSRDTSAHTQLKGEIIALRREMEDLRMKNLQFIEIMNKGSAAAVKLANSMGTQTDKRDSHIFTESVNQSPNYQPYNILDRIAEIKKKHSARGISIRAEGTQEGSDLGPESEYEVPVRFNGDENSKESSSSKESEASRPKNLDKHERAKDEHISQLQQDSKMLRDLLQGQKHRSERLETQIIRLRQEMAVKEERYKDVFQQRDLFYRLLDKASQKPEATFEITYGNQDSMRNSASGSPTINQCKLGTYTKSSPIGNTNGSSPPPDALVGPDASQQPNLLKKNSKTATYTQTSPVKAAEPVTTSASTIQNSNQPLSLKSSSSSSGSNPASGEVPNPRPRLAITKTVNSPSVPFFIETVPPTLSVSEARAIIKVKILWLRLDERSRILTDSNIRALYIDFTILGRSRQDYETPDALSKPSDSGAKIVFNYSVDVSWDDELQQKLTVLNAKPGADREKEMIVLNVMSEPVDEEDEESIASQLEVQCPVVGVCSVSLEQIKVAEPDEELLLSVFDVTREREICGTLAVSLSAPAMLFLNRV